MKGKSHYCITRIKTDQAFRQSALSQKWRNSQHYRSSQTIIIDRVCTIQLSWYGHLTYFDNDYGQTPCRRRLSWLIHLVFGQTQMALLVIQMRSSRIKASYLGRQQQSWGKDVRSEVDRFCFNEETIPIKKKRRSLRICMWYYLW